MSQNCLKFSKNFATRHWRPEVTINVTTVSKHFYEINILPITLVYTVSVASDFFAVSE
jgi:hypothetical protein